MQRPLLGNVEKEVYGGWAAFVQSCISPVKKVNALTIQIGQGIKSAAPSRLRLYRKSHFKNHPRKIQT